jgi:hypothetical protein
MFVLGLDELGRDTLPRGASRKEIRNALRLFDGGCGEVDSAERTEGDCHARSCDQRAAGEDDERLAGEFAPPFTAARNQSRANASHLSKFAPSCADSFHFGTSYD